MFQVCFTRYSLTPSLILGLISAYEEDLYSKFASANFLIPNLSAPLPVKWLTKLGIHELPGGLKVEEFDCLHTLICIDEVRAHPSYSFHALYCKLHKLSSFAV
jgi:hypothetical protein